MRIFVGLGVLIRAVPGPDQIVDSDGHGILLPFEPLPNGQALNEETATQMNKRHI